MGKSLLNDDQDNHKILYRSWGDFLVKKNLFTDANNYYTQYLEIDDDDPKTLYRRSICLRNYARSEEAVRDAKHALKLSPYNPDINLQVPVALFDSNDFENSILELHNTIGKFNKSYTTKVQNRIEIINENYCKSLGNKYALFATSNNLVKVFYDLKRIDDLKKAQEKPLWKHLKEQDKCDVVSILENEEELLHPREIARRKLCYKNFTQRYFHKGSKDLQFLSELRNNKSLLLPQTTKSTKKLSEVAKENFDIAFKFLKMLQARSPVYTEKYKTGRHQILAKREMKHHIYHLQYQTRRDMFNILKKINYLRAERKLDELSKVVDYAIREYVILKTFKVMPRKFEFINEVCNILALAYIDNIDIPNDLVQVEDTVEKLQYLFNATIVKDNIYSNYDFGDYTPFKERQAKKQIYSAYKIRLNILEKRIHFAAFPIEKCYFYHEIAITHLKQSAYDMCITITHEMIKEAEKCNNNAWILLGYYIICKTLAAQVRLERLREAILPAMELTYKLNWKIYRFFQVSYKLINYALTPRKKVIKRVG